MSNRLIYPQGNLTKMIILLNYLLSGISRRRIKKDGAKNNTLLWGSVVLFSTKTYNNHCGGPGRLKPDGLAVGRYPNGPIS